MGDIDAPSTGEILKLCISGWIGLLGTGTVIDLIRFALSSIRGRT